MKQEYKTYDIRFAVYTALDGYKVKLIHEKVAKGRDRLKFHIVNEDPGRDLDKTVKYFFNSIEPNIEGPKRRKVCFDRGELNFDITLLNAIFGRWPDPPKGV